MKNINKYLLICGLSIIAFINATYLSYQAYEFRFSDVSLTSSFCDISKNVSCTEVLKSPYSQVFGIPFPWIAFVVYPVLFWLAYLGYKKKDIFYAKTIQILSFLGLCFNLFIIYRETFLIFSYCILCLICTFIIASIFALSTMVLKESNIYE